MDRTAIQTKDSFHKFAYRSTISVFCSKGIEILDTIRMTEGMWSELDYLYKAAEICEWIVERCDDELRSVQKRSKNKSDLIAIKKRGHYLADRFRLMHNTKDA